MGTCYNVDLYVKKGSNTRKIISLTNKFIKEYEDAIFETNNFNLRTLEGCVKCIITDRNYSLEKTKEETSFSTGFDASYGWEEVIYDWFEEIAPALAVGSRINVWPDEGHTYLIIDGNGKVEDISDEEDDEWDDEDDELSDKELMAKYGMENKK